MYTYFVQNISECYTNFQIEGKVSNEQTRSSENYMNLLILKQNYSDNIVKNMAVLINRNYFLKLITVFELIERIYYWFPSLIFGVRTTRVFEIFEGLPYASNAQKCWRRLLIMHANVTSNKADNVQAVFQEYDWEVLWHSAYSPDLSPPD